MGFVEVGFMLAMVALNGILAAYEIALASVSLARLKVLTRENRAGAKAALRMKENMEGSLVVVQLGLTLVGVVAAAAGGEGAGKRIAPLLGQPLGLAPGLAEFLAIALAVVLLTGVMIVFGELLPRCLPCGTRSWYACACPQP